MASGKRSLCLALILMLWSGVSGCGVGLTPVPTHVPGTGSVQGRILWNGEGTRGIEVKLCEEVSVFGRCSGREYSTGTDERGDYLFQNVAPGEYGLLVRLFDADSWQVVRRQVPFSTREYRVAADETVSVEDQHIHKLDLQLIYPANASQIDDATPTLRWKAYPEAAYYTVYLAPERGSAILVSHRVDGTQVSVSESLLECHYSWTVKALNEYGVKIAEYHGLSRFSVTGQPVSCHLDVIGPYGIVAADGDVVLAWKPHPLADHYKILMWNRTGPKHSRVLDLVGVRECRYALTEPLLPGSYVWTVYAYDASGRQVAGTQILDLIVEGE